MTGPVTVLQEGRTRGRASPRPHGARRQARRAVLVLLLAAVALLVLMAPRAQGPAIVALKAPVVAVRPKPVVEIGRAHV